VRREFESQITGWMPIPFVQFARDCVSSFNWLKFTYATIVNVAIRFVVQKFFNAKRSKKRHSRGLQKIRSMKV
jgi:hypothetical protein